MPPRRTCYDKGDFHFVDVHVGARLRRRRELLGITVQQVAATAGVCFQQIQKYEAAQNRISPSRLYRFARALKVPVTWFFDGLPPITTGKIKVTLPQHELESRETASLVDAYYRIAPERRRAVHRLIKAIIETQPD
jgi:transcriptional regulator with XRE-family HTH domain